MTAPKRVTIRCPECGSVNVREGKIDDNILRCTCYECGKLFNFDVKMEKVVKYDGKKIIG
jgi:transposase-like protein